MKEKSNTLLLTVIGVATLLVAVIGATFAYFTAQISGVESSTTITVGAGTLGIAYADATGEAADGSLVADMIIPQLVNRCSNKDAESYGQSEEACTAAGGTWGETAYSNPVITKYFSITGNNSTVTNMPYTIAIVKTANDFTNNALTYTLDSTNTGSNGTIVPAVTTKTGLASGTGTVTLGTGFFNGEVTNSVHSYVLKIYFDDTGVNQDADKSKNFAGYVSTTVQEIYTTVAP